MMKKDVIYIKKRLLKAKIQSSLFYLFRILPINKNKIVFCCIEGTTGYTCNPKYIAEEIIQQNQEAKLHEKYELVWLVNDTTKEFPKEINVVKNTLWKRAYHLTTAAFWIDNSRKQLEVRKRKGQIYIQTWHAKLGFKPTCLDRGASFSKIAYLVSKHDSDMIDYVLSNSRWYDDTLPSGMIYHGTTLRTGSPRCDILIKAKNDTEFKRTIKQKIIQQLGIACSDKRIEDIHFLMYAPTFRGGSQSINREILANQGFPDYRMLVNKLEERFGGNWVILLRLHPQLVARNLDQGVLEALPELKGKVESVSRIDDMYDVLAGCDGFMTDYSSAAFDAAVMEIPVWLYADDYSEYEGERGKLLWDLREIPFPLAENNEELAKQILLFDENKYKQELKQLFKKAEMIEDGRASENVVRFIRCEGLDG